MSRWALGVMGWLKGRMDNAFGIVNQHLVNRAFMVGDQPTMADFLCAVTCSTRWKKAATTWPRATPTFMRWLQRLRQLPGWPALRNAAW